MDLKSLKADIRRQVIVQIRAIEPTDRRHQESALRDRFQDLPGYREAPTVLLYCSAFSEEVETRPFLRTTLDLGKRLVVPEVDRRARRLRLREIVDLDRELRPGHRGIPEPRPDCKLVEPAEVDWILVPGLAFDGQARRLGRGAGHYDRLLPELRPEVPRWALILDAQWVAEVPEEPHDQPLDGVAGPSRTVLGRR